MADQPKNQSKGNLRGFLNRQKMPGDNRPVFQGKLTLPGQAQERGFALWSYTSEKSGQSVLSGSAGASAAEQIDKMTNPPREHDTDSAIAIEQKGGGEALQMKPNSIVMFTNKGKDASTQSRPDYWGYYNPGGKEPLMRLAAWTDTDRSGNAMITGSVVRQQPPRTMDSAEAASAPEKPRKHDEHDEEEEQESEHAR